VVSLGKWPPNSSRRRWGASHLQAVRDTVGGVHSFAMVFNEDGSCRGRDKRLRPHVHPTQRFDAMVTYAEAGQRCAVDLGKRRMHASGAKEGGMLELEGRLGTWSRFEMIRPPA
jgi:hypothetical protein